MNTFKNLIKCFLVSLVLIGCDDLERFPFASIEQTQSFQTVGDAATWNTGLYANLRGNVYGPFTYATDVQADQLNATLDYGNRNGFPHRWEGFLADDGLLRTHWGNYYSAINNINVALAGFETIPTENQDEEDELDLYRADAYLARAFYYHNLVVRFAQDYDPSSASSDLGVPIVLEYDLQARPSRNTVEEVYQQILSDINTARPALSSVNGSSGAQRFNIDVLRALEARVRFYMHDWQGAKTIADQLIGSGRYPLITTEEGLNNMWTNDFPQEVIMQLFVSAPNELANTNDIYLRYQGAEDVFQPDFVPSQWVVDMYEDDDIRKNVYFTNDETVRISGIDYSDIWIVNKYPGNPDLFTAANTNYQQAPKVFRIAEMYLISAESALNIPGGNALTPLNALRQARGLDALAVSGDDLVDAVRDERFRELAFEGFRLDDLKRWDEGFTRRDPQNTAMLLQGANTFTKSVEETNPKFIWGIPTFDVTLNPNLADQQNPGW